MNHVVTAREGEDLRNLAPADLLARSAPDVAPRHTLSDDYKARLISHARFVNPKPQTGIWQLTAPDGRTWSGESPIDVLQAELGSRVPREVRDARLLLAVHEVEWADSEGGEL